MSPLEEQAAEEFARRVRTRFAARLRDLRVFGSRARREARPDSDLDVLVLLDVAPRSERMEISDLATDLMMEEDLPFPIAPLVMSEADYQSLQARERLLPREIERDGIPL